MKIQDSLTLVIAITTVAYTIGTFLLWRETRRALKQSVEEFQLTQKRIKADLIANLVSWHRDLFSYILSKDNFVSLLAKTKNVDKDKLQSSLLASLLINNVSQAYYHYKQGNIDEEMWNILGEDTKELFSWPFVSERWEEVKNLHPSGFRVFVEEKILKPGEPIKEEGNAV